MIAGPDLTAAPATHRPPGIGHNGGPTDQRNEPFGLRAAWLHFANALELRRLAKLQARINRRHQSLNEMIAERQLIMNRCIRRMRRKQGKN